MLITKNSGDWTVTVELNSWEVQHDIGELILVQWHGYTRIVDNGPLSDYITVYATDERGYQNILAVLDGFHTLAEHLEAAELLDILTLVNVVVP